MKKKAILLTGFGGKKKRMGSDGIYFNFYNWRKKIKEKRIINPALFSAVLLWKSAWHKQVNIRMINFTSVFWVIAHGQYYSLMILCLECHCGKTVVRYNCLPHRKPEEETERLKEAWHKNIFWRMHQVTYVLKLSYIIIQYNL